MFTKLCLAGMAQIIMITMASSHTKVNSTMTRSHKADLVIKHHHGLDFAVDSRHARDVALLDDLDSFLSPPLLIDPELYYPFCTPTQLSDEPRQEYTVSTTLLYARAK